MSQVVSCELCTQEPGVDPFAMPFDQIGAVLMFCHLEEKHSTADAEKFREWCRTFDITV